MGQRTDRGCLNCKRNSMKIKTLKILNYQLKLSGPQLSHLDRRPIFAAYILILQLHITWSIGPAQRQGGRELQNKFNHDYLSKTRMLQ